MSLYSYTSADNGRRYGVANVYVENPLLLLDTVSFSGAQNVQVDGWIVPGCSRSVVGVYDSSDIECRLEEAVPNGRVAATVANSKRVYLAIEKLTTRGKVCDVLVGDCEKVTLNVVAADGKPVRVISRNGRVAERDLVKGGKSGPYTYAFAWSRLGVFAFLGYLLGPAMAYANPRWLGRPWGLVYDALFGGAK